MYNTDNTAFVGLLTGLGIFAIILVILVLALAIVCIVAQWKLFKKAGKKGWEAIIPFYSTWVLIEIAGLNWWYFLLAISGSILSLLGIEGLGFITNIAGWFVNFLCFYNLAKKTKQNEILYGILGIFISYVPILILGFSNKITFDNSIEVSPNGIIGDKKTTNNNNTTNTQTQGQERYCLGCGQKLGNNVKFCENCGKKVEDF